MYQFSITDQPVDPVFLRESLMREDAGAFASFEGWVRNHHQGKVVQSLEYEAYHTLASQEGTRILKLAQEQFDIHAAVAQHRIGHLQPSDIAVWIGVCSAHRDTAFAACRFIIEEFKKSLPVWKKEHYTDDSCGWVDPIS